MLKTTGAKRVTLQDIANETGYTVNTVSRALKNKKDISKATCEHIQQVARDMGYVRNYMASSLRSGRTKTLGVIVGGMSNPFYSIMSDAIQDVATSLGYSLMILCSRDTPEIEQRVVETAISRQVDGILLFPNAHSSEAINRMKRAGMPFVLLSRYLTQGEDDCVLCDEEQGAYLATKHLIEGGKRKLGYMYCFDVVYSTESRRQGFLRACKECGIPQNDIHIALCPNDASVRQTLTQWRAQGVNGLFAFCDMEAWNIIALLRNEGLRVPRDFAIAAFDNIQGTLQFPFPLCSVDGRMPDIARSGIELLRKRIHGEELPPQSIVYPVELVCRGSCGRE